jgi:hypothetical protein
MNTTSLTFKLLKIPGGILIKAVASTGFVIDADLNKGISTVHRVPAAFIDLIIAFVIKTNRLLNFLYQII